MAGEPVPVRRELDQRHRDRHPPDQPGLDPAAAGRLARSRRPFEHDELAVRQIRWHQQYLAAFRSRGSSANNHVIAEAAGQLVASCAFPWFPESDRWRRTSARLLERELVRNTFPSGIGRELASDYQCFVAELGLLAAVEAEAAGYPLSAAAWQRLCAMVDSGAALLDERLRPPRQGDGDDGRALLLDAPDGQPLALAAGPGGGALRPARLVAAHDGGRGQLDHRRAARRAREVAGRPARRPWHFADAGMTLLRTTGDREPEIWCRCDGGPHGFLSIAAHAHADALSVEVRYGGVDILADPGTYCYHGEPAWRSYFRSTIAHNTVELDGRTSPPTAARSSGCGTRTPGKSASRTSETRPSGPPSTTATWSLSRRPGTAAASGSTGPRAASTSSTRSAAAAMSSGSRSTSAPMFEAELDGACAVLRWPGASAPGAARLELPQQLRWSLHRGETDPILGWYSSGLGRRIPAFTLIGRGRSRPVNPLPRG